jgi:hypothetical protein
MGKITQKAKHVNLCVLLKIYGAHALYAASFSFCRPDFSTSGQTMHCMHAVATRGASGIP